MVSLRIDNVENSGGSGEPDARVLARATLDDVARLAGVSSKTVSRVLSSQTNVRAETRERVLEAAQRLRFRPDDLARELRRGTVSTNVAVVLGDLSNPVYSAVAAGIEHELTIHGLTMLLATTDDDPDREARVVAALLERQVRSLLIAPIAADQSYLEGERRRGTPVVCVDRPARNLAADAVVLANRAGATEAVRSLIAHGHRRIAFVGSSPTLYTHGQRLDGYRQALYDAGLGGNRAWERADGSDAPSAEHAARELLTGSDAPTAILAGDNRASTGVLRALRSLHGVAPSVGFIGFDDFDLADTLGISVVAYDPERMGREAARLALGRTADDDVAPRQVVLPTRLVLRGSGEVAPRGVA